MGLSKPSLKSFSESEMLALSDDSDAYVVSSDDPNPIPAPRLILFHQTQEHYIFLFLHPSCS